DAQGFRVSYDLGLSPQTPTPSTATVTFWIYTQNPKWGMRSTAEKYYALNSNDFTTRATVQGAWVVTGGSLSGIPNPQDFGWGYEEFDDELDFDNAHGIVGSHYVSPPNWYINISGYEQQPPYDVLVSTLQAALSDSGYTVDSIPTAQMAAATVASSPYDENDHYQLSWNSYYWYDNRLQKYPMMVFPSLSTGPYDLITKYCVDKRIDRAEGNGDTLG